MLISWNHSYVPLPTSHVKPGDDQVVPEVLPRVTPACYNVIMPGYCLQSPMHGSPLACPAPNINMQNVSLRSGPWEHHLGRENRKCSRGSHVSSFLWPTSSCYHLMATSHRCGERVSVSVQGRRVSRVISCEYLTIWHIASLIIS